MWCCLCLTIVLFVFFKQKAAYEMRISDWSSDVVLFRSPDNAGRRGRLDRDARQLRGGVDQRFERQIDPRRDDPAQIGAVGADMVEGRRGAEADDELVLARLDRLRRNGVARAVRSEERRVGEEWFSTGRSRGCADH